MRQRLLDRCLLVLLALWVSAIPAWSAAKPTAPQSTAAQKRAEAPVAIEVTDVVPRSVRALNRLREIRQKLDTDNSISVVETGLPSFALKLDEWWKAEVSTIQEVRSVQRLTDVLWEWRQWETQINSWSALLTTSSKDWIAEEQTLDRLAANWQATQTALKKSAPSAVRDKIVDVLREVDRTSGLFREKTSHLVAAQGKLAARLERLNEIRTEIAAIREQSNLDLFSPERPPLWTLLVIAESPQSIASQTGESASKLYAGAVNFFQVYRKRLLVHLALFLVMLALFYRLRYLSRIPGEIKPTAAERFVLDRSFTSALLLALLCVPLVYSGASPQIQRIGAIPVVIPILMLVPAIFAPRLRIGIYFLTVIFLLDFPRNFLPPQWLLVRLLLLAVACLGSVGLAAVLRAVKSAPEASPYYAGAMRSLLHIALGLFVASAVANMVGNLTLAEILVSPLVRIFYLGVVIRIGAVVGTTFSLMALRAPLLQLSRTVRERGEAVAAQGRRLVNLAAVGLWIIVALFNLGVLEDLQDDLDNFLQLQWRVGAAEISVSDFANFLVVFFSAYVLSRLLRVILSEEIFPRFQMPRGVPDALELLARYGVLLFGFLLALTSAGVNLSQVTLAISALGVGIGFGLQNIVNNFVSGLILVFEHPIQVGDFVEVGTHFGRVRRIGFRASVVRTRDGAEVIVPNAELIGTKVINWSLSDQLRRLTIHVPVAIGTDPSRVIEILNSVARGCPAVLADPPPSAALEQFGDSSLKFQLRCWVKGENFGSARNQLTLSVDKAFQEAGIRIPFPQSDVHVHWSDNPSVGIAPIEKPK